MDLHAGEEASDMRCKSGQEKKIMHPEEVGYPVQPDGMESRIAGYDFRTDLAAGLWQRPSGYLL